MSYVHEGDYRFDFGYKVDYREVRGNPRPIIVMEFYYQRESIKCPMLVDSGADNILIPKSYAEVLGIDLSPFPIGNGDTCYFGNADASCFPDLDFSIPGVTDRIFTNPVYFADFLDSRYQFGLLGREIFNRIRFCFNHETEDSFYLDFNG